MLNSSELPDLAAVVLLTCAFASVARRSQTQASGLWLIGWVLIALHFASFTFQSLPGIGGTLATISGLTTLTWAAVLFMWASIPHRHEKSSRWMLAALLFTFSLYIALTVIQAPSWALIPAAVMIGAIPLTIAVSALPKFNHPLRWAMVGNNCLLSAFLLVYQTRPGNGAYLALNALLFSVYLGCCIHFWYAYRRATAGAFITIAGFFAWASVFVLAPTMQAYLPAVHIDGEVWNLPKYVVAVGMILLLLENQIEHNKFLALHDDLTGLPNRRLFQDRLASALERARRNNAQVALLLIDLNGFKLVNDTLGHHVGDLLLQRVGTVFSGRVRRSDTVARTGGDEFSVILEAPIGRKDAARVGQCLIQLLNDPLELEKHSVRTSASLGIAVFPEDASDLESLCISADQRMYADKHRSGNHGEPLNSVSSSPYPELERGSITN